MSTVQNRMADRCKAIQKVGDQYEFGWRCGSDFRKVGAGTYEEATAWMDTDLIAIRPPAPSNLGLKRK